MSNSSSSTSLTGIIHNLNSNGSASKSINSQSDSLATKKKRFKSQENGVLDTSESSFSTCSSTNENKFKKNKVNDSNGLGK